MQDYGQQDDDDDEDLSRNPLVLHLQSNYPLLYEEALREGWTLCVPSVNTLCQHCFDEDYIQQHLIRNNQDSSFTLSNKPVQIDSNTVTIGGTQTPIILRETIYTKLGKLSVICIQDTVNSLSSDEQPSKTSPTGVPTPNQQRFIKDAVRSLKKKLARFKLRDELPKTRLQFYTETIQDYLRNQDVKTCNCIIHNLYDSIMDIICISTSQEDGQLNKIRANAACVDMVRPPDELAAEGAADALRILDTIASKRTADAKLVALKETVAALVAGADAPRPLNADRLLTLFAHLISRSRVADWNGQLQFMKRFNARPDRFGEEAYYLSTVEAAVGHLKSLEPASHRFPAPSAVAAGSLLDLAIGGDAGQLEELLCGSRFQCHPLCPCESCGSPLVEDAVGVRHPGTAMTALHLACANGNTEATQVLLRTTFQDDVQALDRMGRTALHWAACRGFQTCLLLLCHQDCDLNVCDAEGNSALHLAVRHGHESCVKALLYFAEHGHTQLDLNGRNNDGDTALHLAARAGYAAIAELLVQWGAGPFVLNWSRRTAADVAHNSKLVQCLAGPQHRGHLPGSAFRKTHSLWTGIKRSLKR